MSSAEEGGGVEVPEDMKYAKSHEWIKVDGDKGKIGITYHAQNELTDIVYIELPGVGASFTKDQEMCVVESVKTVSDILCPVDGEIVEVNEALPDKPETVNSDPYGDGWLVVIKISDKKQVDEMMDATAYKEFIGVSD